LRGAQTRVDLPPGKLKGAQRSTVSHFYGCLRDKYLQRRQG